MLACFMHLSSEESLDTELESNSFSISFKPIDVPQVEKVLHVGATDDGSHGGDTILG